MSGSHDVGSGARRSIALLFLAGAVVGCSTNVPSGSGASGDEPTATAVETASAGSPTEAAPTAGENTPDVTTTPTATPTPTPTPVPTADPTPTAVVDPFGRHDTPPSGVSGSIGYGTPSGQRCRRPGDAPPDPWVWIGRGFVGIPRALCASGFLPGQVVLSFVGPDGVERERQLTAPDTGFAVWLLDDLPTPYEGSWSLRASQEATTVTSEAVVEVGARDVAIIPEEVPRGDRVHVVAHQPAGAGQAPAYLYRRGVGDDGLAAWLFAADLGFTQLDDLGEGRFTLATSPDDEPGEYAVHTVDILAGFRLLE